MPSATHLHNRTHNYEALLKILYNCDITTKFLENNTQSEVTNNMLHHTKSTAPIDISCLRNSLISSDPFFNTAAQQDAHEALLKIVYYILDTQT